jgi:hypothetical protein
MDNSIGVFISYSRQNLFEATTLAQELSRIGCRCWIDFDGIAGGDVWRKSIQQALQRTILMVVILTPESVQSQWVMFEVENAIKCGHTVIPVMFRKCAVPEQLEPYQYVDFTRGPDYETLFRSILIAVARRAHQQPGSPLPIEKPTQMPRSTGAAGLGPPTENIALERPDGTMHPESLFYIERHGDHILKRELSSEYGATVVIKAPRQVGKSSMLVHSIPHAEKVGKRVALLDFQSLDTLTDPTAFYQEFCATIVDRLGLEDRIDDVWKRGRSNTRACTVFMERHILKELDTPLVLAIDETDRMLDCPFRSDFFGMLRAWHNSRGTMGDIWRRLDMVLVISTEPYMLIENSAQSPFNVGEVIKLEDFSEEDVKLLNERHGYSFDPTELGALYQLLWGHPYLVRQALYRVAIHETSPTAILSDAQYASGNGGVFDDHLRRYLSYFNEQPHLRDVMLGIISQQAQPSESDFQRLHGAGLVRLYRDQQVIPRCKLYHLYFGKKLR